MPNIMQWLAPWFGQTVNELRRLRSTQELNLIVRFIGRSPKVIGATQNVSQQLAEAWGDTHFTCFKDIVLKPYQELKNVLAKEFFDELQDQKYWGHAIELVPEAQMFSTKIYPLALVEKKQLDKFLNEKLKSQQICPLKPLMASPTDISHWHLPLFFHQEEGWNLHLVHDYWKLNMMMTMNNTYPLPLIPDILKKYLKLKQSISLS